MNRKHILIVLISILFGFFTWIMFYSNGVLKLMFNEKIWVHRVNSIEKLSEVQANFYGVELDVVFIDSLNIFDVNHPPAESINLSLENFLSSIKENKSLHFWLDFKNLSGQNQKNAVYRLNAICELLVLSRSNFIIESSSVLLLREFAEAGYQISYYLHWPGLYSLDSSGLQKELNDIKVNLSQLKFNVYLSSYYRDYDILKKNFPEYDIILWLDDSFGKQD